MKAKLFIAIGALAAMVWAAPIAGAAHFLVQQAAATNRVAPAAARFQVDRDRGLLVPIWINDKGPFVFALDTGAGMNVVSQRLVTAVALLTKAVPQTTLGGLSSTRTSSNRGVTLEKLAVGERTNLLPSRQTALIVSNLPADIDGILDPTEAYAPFGFTIDMPNEQIAGLDVDGFTRARTSGAEGAIVPWIRNPGDSRPFVRLGDGRLALVDTGSGFGLAVNGRNAVIVGPSGENAIIVTNRDIAGGLIRSRRVAPTTISIGELVLRRIPTDILFGVHDRIPLILGRDALSPFRISFDPKRSLIEFVAGA